MEPGPTFNPLQIPAGLEKDTYLDFSSSGQRILKSLWIYVLSFSFLCEGVGKIHGGNKKATQLPRVRGGQGSIFTGKEAFPQLQLPHG